MRFLPSVFRNTNFLKVWGNQILLQVGFNMSNYTALLILGNRTHSPFVQSQFYAALTFPAFIFGVIAGPVVDTASKKMLMLWTSGLLAILFACYIFTNEKTFPILLLAFASASVARFFIPAEAAAIPALVSEEELGAANSAFLFTLLGSVLIGYSLAGPLIQLSGGLGSKGENVPFIISSLSLLLGFVLCFFIPHQDKRKLTLPQGGLMVRTLKLFWETVREARENKLISLSLILLIFVELNIGILSVVLLEYVSRYLKLPLTSITYYLIFPLVLGLIVGVATLKRVQEKMGVRKSIALSCLAIGILFFALGILPKIITLVTLLRFFSIVTSLLVGIGIVYIAVQARTVLQLVTPSTMQGRVFSFLDVMVALVTPIPVLFLGFFASKVSLLSTFMVFGGLVVLIAIVGDKFYTNTR